MTSFSSNFDRMSFPPSSRSPSRSGASSPFKRLKISTPLDPHFGTSQRSPSVITNNPLSHSPSSLRQFSVAGAPVDEQNPSETTPNFPHRRLKRENFGGGGGYASEWTDVEESEFSGGEGVRGKRGKGRSHELIGHNKVLIEAIYLDLEMAKVEEAGKLFGQLIQQKEKSVAIDIRKHNLWNLGAEIIMREGEKPFNPHNIVTDEGARKVEGRKRWGDAKNMPKVRAYYDSLITRYPYDHKRPEYVSAVDFWVALLNCEIYNAYTEQRLALQRLADPNNDEELDQESDEGPSLEDFEESRRWREAAILKKKDEIRRKTLSMMQGVAARMDELMRDPPYSKLNEYARIRGMLSLYIADLLVPAAESISQTDLYIAQQRKADEQAYAKDMFRRVLNNDGELDEDTMRFVDPDADTSEMGGFSVYSSLPAR